MFKGYSKITISHAILFFLTVITTFLAGAIMQGANILANPTTILQGAPFSVTLILILGTHEFGHYYFAQKHNVDATLPYFIPAPNIIALGEARTRLQNLFYPKFFCWLFWFYDTHLQVLYFRRPFFVY